MGLLKSSMPVCPRSEHCSQWAWKYMDYCLCSKKDGVSLTLGLISVISWGIAEIPQLITNYNGKSAEGLSIAFLLTWVLGDLFNLFGCLLEPATLPTQYYMAVLYTVTTLLLTTQTIYYGHVYPRLKYNRRRQKFPNPSQAGEGDKLRKNSSGAKLGNNGAYKSEGQNTPSLPIPLPSIYNGSPGKELYYTSARSLTRSHTPTAGSCLTMKMTSTSVPTLGTIEEPLLDEQVSTRYVSPANTRTMLCLVSAVTFLGTLNFHQSSDGRVNFVSDKSSHGLVMPVARRLLQVNGGLLQEHGTEGGDIGSFFGWGMAAIYMGGRLPQIYLNIRRGNVQGLNPFMFIFALVGNATYVASILVSSMEWSRIRPNLPWLVDAGGCILLDCFIIFQFMYFNNRTSKDVESKCNLSGDEGAYLQGGNSFSSSK